MAKVLPFPSRRRPRHEAAAYVLALSTRCERSSAPPRRPREPERLGNLLQRLTRKRPAVVFVIEKVVADICDELERNP
jgi:plasmid stabilization system protein ParE